MANSVPRPRHPRMVLQYIPLNQLEVSRSNVRQRERVADVDELARSMDVDGLLQPIVVQRNNGHYEIIIGQRRYLAARQLGWDEIPAYVRPERLDEFDAKIISFSENIQRRDLNPRDKADACTYLLGQLGSIAAVADRLAITEQTVRKWLGYAAVPEGLKALVDEKKISAPIALRLAEYIPNEAKAVQIAERIAELKPPARHRERILSAVEEAPDRSIDSIFRRAEEKRREKQVFFVLPEKWALAIERAEKSFGRTANDIARDATIRWLEENRV